MQVVRADLDDILSRFLLSNGAVLVKPLGFVDAAFLDRQFYGENRESRFKAVTRWTLHLVGIKGKLPLTV